MINVMIVEDDQVFLSHLCRIVASDADLELFAAVRDGVSARQSLVRGEPDVLLVDLGLPDMSGIEVIRNARRQFAQLASAGDVVEDRAEAGVDQGSGLR